MRFSYLALVQDKKLRAFYRQMHAVQFMSIEFLLGSSGVESFRFNSLYNKSQISDATPSQQHIYIETTK